MTTAIAMKERPILFSAPMVRAILEGRKTQTRRVVKDQGAISDICGGGIEPVVWWPRNEKGEMPCPYGVPGDRLWVRESCLIWSTPQQQVVYSDDREWKDILVDKAVLDADAKQGRKPAHVGNWKSTPSIFMPRWASRITLEITNVRVERVQDIGAEDAVAEGIQYRVAKTKEPGKVSPLICISERPCVLDYLPPKSTLWTHEILLRSHYARLWDSINGKTYPWESNPWVWVIAFQRLAQ